MPLARGHTLVIPKEPAETLDKLSDDAAAAIGRVLPRISRAVLAATGATAVQRAAEQRPARAPGRVPRPLPHHPEATTTATGLGIGWPAGKLEDGAALAKAIASKL